MVGVLILHKTQLCFHFRPKEQDPTMTTFHIIKLMNIGNSTNVSSEVRFTVPGL